jgi:predicted enzyme related to lactoylglutathione lyase
MRNTPPFQISHFSINADDVARAQKFYEAIFGWKFTAWGPPGFFLIETGGIVHGSLQQRQKPLEGSGIRGFECTVSVHDVDDSVAKITSAGGTVHYPKSTIPGVGDIASFFDPEGNYFLIAKYEA